MSTGTMLPSATFTRSAPENVKKAGLKVVYSPLCGAGGEPVSEMLTRLGAELHIPESQRMPSGDFASCPTPNPETDSAFDENYKLAAEVRPDLILATDPDSDRIAAAIPVDGGFRKFSGNEMGCLLLDYILRNLKKNGTQSGAGDGLFALRNRRNRRVRHRLQLRCGGEAVRVGQNRL